MNFWLVTMALSCTADVLDKMSFFRLCERCTPCCVRGVATCAMQKKCKHPNQQRQQQQQQTYNSPPPQCLRTVLTCAAWRFFPLAVAATALALALLPPALLRRADPFPFSSSKDGSRKKPTFRKKEVRDNRDITEDAPHSCTYTGSRWTY